jgi:hypothetical protein
MNATATAQWDRRMSRAPLVCVYCGRVSHGGRCRLWYAAHPEFKAKISTKLRAAETHKGYPMGWRPSSVHLTRQWKDAAREVKEGLLFEFMRGGDTGPWVLKLRELLDMKENGPHVVRGKELEDVEAI